MTLGAPIYLHGHTKTTHAAPKTQTPAATLTTTETRGQQYLLRVIKISCLLPGFSPH
ncbi:MAG TPA: hypothetical protein IGS52_11295 [Oscillatoriaceae cyanobacterium M33_DOE_052]|nr:hypothetical protein [Oscillatoriaceae cyanobacterium M33_DOE_052]